VPTRDSEPEPEVSIARGKPGDYWDRHPGPEDVALVVEVVRCDVADDRALAATYGGGGVPAYWIVNLIDRQLEVYAHSTEGAYPAPTILGETESVELIIGGQVVGRIAVADLLP
jgi:Uma2 family endonuclease